MRIKILTSVYSDLYGSDMGGRPGRKDHYRFSLLSLLKMSDADFVCYTSNREKNDLEKFVEKLKPISELTLARHIKDEKIGKEQFIEDGKFYLKNFSDAAEKTL